MRTLLCQMFQRRQSLKDLVIHQTLTAKEMGIKYKQNNREGEEQGGKNDGIGMIHNTSYYNTDTNAIKQSINVEINPE